MKNAKLRKSYRSLFTVHPGLALRSGAGCSLPKGFTLLEIMIALAIVGAVVITILYTVNYHADTAYEHTVTTRMFLAAKEKIAEMEQNPQDAKGNIAGTDYTYENSVNTTKDEGIIEIKTIINKNGKKVILSELVIKKEIQNPQ